MYRRWEKEQEDVGSERCEVGSWKWEAGSEKAEGGSMKQEVRSQRLEIVPRGGSMWNIELRVVRQGKM